MPDESDDLIYGARQSLASAEAELREEAQARRELAEPPVEILGSHMDTIERLLNERKSLAGECVEFGTYAGATAFQWAELLKGTGRTLYVFDTFSGIPAQDFTEGLDVDEPGKFKAPVSTYARMRLAPNIKPIKGRIEETLWAHHFPVLCAYLDLDLNRSTKVALDWLAQHLVSGGAIVVDDWRTHRGIRLAVEQFGDAHPTRTRFINDEVILWR